MIESLAAAQAEYDAITAAIRSELVRWRHSRPRLAKQVGLRAVYSIGLLLQSLGEQGGEACAMEDTGTAAEEEFLAPKTSTQSESESESQFIDGSRPTRSRSGQIVEREDEEVDTHGESVKRLKLIAAADRRNATQWGISSDHRG